MTTKQVKQLSKVQLDKIIAGKMGSFHGGIHPPENKLQSSQASIEEAGIPPFLIIGIEDGKTVPALLVNVGDYVLKGQPLTKAYGSLVVHHASSSGTVDAIEKRTDLHPSGLSILSIVIKTDGLDKSINYPTLENYQAQTQQDLVQRIQNAGVIGLGGAGFPTHLKLKHRKKISLLIVNGAECEPYITADDRLMQEQSDAILLGAEIAQKIIEPELIVIAIEDNKPEAIAAFEKALAKKPNKNIVIRTIRTHYPSGSGKQLTEIITGKQVPYKKHLTDIGMGMLNVGTLFAIKEAIIDGKPLMSRIVTLTGEAFQQKGNVNVRIGTPIQYLLDKYKYTENPKQKLIIGGPLMGFTIAHGDIPVTKICNCILAPTQKEIPEPPLEMPCIRCSECAEACPAELLPQQLLWYSKSQDHDKLEEYNLSSCIECGACAFVCPSHIPLVQYYRVAKAQIKNTKEQAKKSEIAQVRFEKRQARLDQAKLDRQAKHKEAALQRQAQLKEQNGGVDIVAAALDRVKAPVDQANQTTSTATDKKVNPAVAAAIARAKAKKEAAKQANETPTAPTIMAASGSSKNPAVAAAVARAKAKKETAKQANKTPTTPATITASGSSKNPAVAAAVARAKAKKEAAKQANETPTAPATITASGSSKNPAVAAAVARAKAKKEAAKQANETPTAPTTIAASGSSKTPAVAAAVARAKAKKEAEKQKNAATLSISDSQTDDSDKITNNNQQARIATAIAKAKAKQAAQGDK